MMRSAVILCGGGSRRMGRDKASLAIGAESFLGRTVRLVSGVVPAERVVCVAAANQHLPSLPHQVTLVRDEAPDQGPLAAIVDGMRALEPATGLVLVVGCDTPLLSTALLQALFTDAEQSDATIARLDGRDQPFPGVYSASLVQTASRLLAEGQKSMHSLLEAANVQRLEEASVREADPQFHSFINCNSDTDYQYLLEVHQASS